MKKQVTERALFARVDRKLKKGGDCLRRCRQDSKAHAELGSYYIVSSSNVITAQHCSLEGLARELGVLAEWEVLEG